MHFIESETDRHDRDDGTTTTKLMEKLFCFQVLIQKNFIYETNDDICYVLCIRIT